MSDNPAKKKENDETLQERLAGASEKELSDKSNIINESKDLFDLEIGLAMIDAKNVVKDSRKVQGKSVSIDCVLQCSQYSSP